MALKDASLARPGSTRAPFKGSKWVEVPVGPVGAAVDQDWPKRRTDFADTIDALPSEVVERAGVVSAAVFVPDAALTGQATNFRTWSLVNKGANGAGNTSMGAGFASTSGNNLVAEAETALVVTVGTVAAGDRISVRSLHSGTGQADPGGVVRFRIDYT
jgi:hypothetical protein